MQIEGVSSVAFGDDAVEVAGESYRYETIRVLTWHAMVTQNSINGIPTGKSYKSTFYFFSGQLGPIWVHPDSAWLGPGKRKAFVGLGRAAEILSELTFTHRMERYEEHIKAKGFFSYGQYQFHRSGDVFKEGLLAFNLTDVDLIRKVDLFTLAITPRKQNGKWFKNLFRQDFLVPIITDRDCFLYLLNSLYGLTFTDETLRLKRRDRRKLYYSTAISLGALIASADGNAESKELNALREYFQISREEFPNATTLFNEQLHNPKTVHELLWEFAEEFNEDAQLKEMFLFGMGRVAIADGVLHENELTALLRIANELKIDLSTANRILASLGIHFNDARQDNTNFKKGGGSGSYYATLGLNQTATLAEVKIAYRVLVRRYHPDVLRSQNLPEEEQEAAEALMREINNAYEWILSNR